MGVSISLWLSEGHLVINFDLISYIMEKIKIMWYIFAYSKISATYARLKHFQDRVFTSIY